VIIYKTKSRIIFEVLNYLLFTVFSLLIVLPFLNIIAISLSSNQAVSSGQVTFWPKGFNLLAYAKIVTNWGFIVSFMNTVFITVADTILIIGIALLAGYVLANKHMIGKKFLFVYFIIPMYFSGGIIPLYILVNRLKLTNSMLALILPVIVSPFYIMVFRNNIVNNIPKDLMESAEIDGAGDFTILIRIVIPLLLPVIIAFAIMSGVGYWNEWYYCLLFIRDKTKWTLQYRLKYILTLYEITDNTPGAPFRMFQTDAKIHRQSMKMAALIVSVLPIFLIYPFMQKYFIHGIVVGAVKG